ncbi:MAG: hypothetical protein ACRDHV_02620 [Actinomycetota bacterium]
MRMTRAFRILMAAVAVLVVLVIVTGPALAQPTYPPTTPPTSPANVAPTAIVPGAGVAPNVEQPGVQGEGVGALAFTGAELTLLVATFGILLAGGAVALIAARRRSRPQTG